MNLRFFDVRLPPPSTSYRAARQALHYVPQTLMAERHFHRGDASATVLHISTVGNNASSSRCTSGLLSAFHAITPLQAVVSDSWSGEANLAAIRARSRRELDQLLQQNRLLAQIHFAGTIVDNIRLYGVEDSDVLQDALQAQQLVFQRQNEAAQYLRQLTAALGNWPASAPPNLATPLTHPKKWCKQLSDLLTLQLEYEQWTEMEPFLEELGPGGFERALAQQCGSKAGVVPTVSNGVQQTAAAAIRFYRSAVKRGDTFARRTLEFLSVTRSTWIASCFTGFQASIFLNALRGADVSYLHFMPRLDADELDEQGVNLFETHVDMLFAPPQE